MDPGDIWQLIVLAVCLIFSAIFSASETALVSLSKIRIRNMVDENVSGARTIQKLVQDPGKMLGAILVGNNVVNIGASALATSLAIRYFGNTGVGIATVITTLLVLIFGEITPKSLAAVNSEKISLKVASFITFFVTVISPVTSVLMHLTNAITKILGGKINKKMPFITEEEFKTIVNVGHEEGVLQGEEKKMIQNVLEFGESKVSEMMTPLIDMVAVELYTPYNSIIEVFKQKRFSRIPVYEDRMDNVVGVLYLKDLFFFDLEDEAFNVTRYMREPYFTFENKLIVQLFNEMRNNRIQMAIVLDEYGGTAGIITMQDLIEEIVGDIRDEFDGHYNEIEIINEDEYIARGVVKIDLINEMLGVNIESEDFDSIGGYITGLLGRLPEEGDLIENNNIKFIVENVHKNRIEKLRILI